MLWSIALICTVVTDGFTRNRFSKLSQSGKKNVVFSVEINRLILYYTTVTILYFIEIQTWCAHMCTSFFSKITLKDGT